MEEIASKIPASRNAQADTLREIQAATKLAAPSPVTTAKGFENLSVFALVLRCVDNYIVVQSANTLEKEFLTGSRKAV